MNQKYTSTYLPLEGGVWALKDRAGKIYIPTNMPIALKQANCQSNCHLSPDLNVVSIYQSGEIVRILSFELAQE